MLFWKHIYIFFFFRKPGRTAFQSALLYLCIGYNNRECSRIFSPETMNHAADLWREFCLQTGPFVSGNNGVSHFLRRNRGNETFFCSRTTCNLNF